MNMAKLKNKQISHEDSFKMFYSLITALLIISFLIFFFIFLFTLNIFFGYASLLLCILIFIFVYMRIKDNKADLLKNLLELNEQKINLIIQKNNLQKDYLKRKVNDKDYNSRVDQLDLDLIDIEYKILFFDSDNMPKDEQINSMISIVDKKYVKREISEYVFNKKKSELSAQLEQINRKAS